jgi:hypothetical protein
MGKKRKEAVDDETSINIFKVTGTITHMQRKLLAWNK